MKKNNDWRSAFITIIIYGLLCYLFAYHLIREQTTQLLLTYSTIFICYLLLLNSKRFEHNFQLFLFGTIFLRLIFLFSIPNLSDDVYRFLWDGNLTSNSINPYNFTPYEAFNSDMVHPSKIWLYEKLNSTNYFTIYPPFSQFIFWISVIIIDSIQQNIIIMRIFILLSELGSIFLIIELLKKNNLSKEKVWIYAYNPLIIIELNGSVHFEAIMIFFILLSIYCFYKYQKFFSALFFSLAIATKIIPILLLPSFLKKENYRSSLKFYLLVILFSSVLLFPIMNSSFIGGYMTSVQLFFQKFEFNGSIYYLVREVGYFIFGYNIIGVAGRSLAILSIVIIILFSLRVKQNMIIMEKMMWILIIFFLLATTVHPWYISTILMLSIFTNYRFIVLWTFTIFFTYTAYHYHYVEENLYFIAFEYLSLILYMVFEFYQNRKKVGYLRFKNITNRF